MGDGIRAYERSLRLYAIGRSKRFIVGKDFIW